MKIVITPDKSRWTSVPVFEIQHDPTFAQLGVEKMFLRGALSVDKNGLNQSQAGVNEDEATYFGEQVYTTEYVDELIDDLDEDELNDFLIAVDNEYPSLNIVEGVGSSTEFFPFRLVGLSFGMGYFPGFAINPETGKV